MANLYKTQNLILLAIDTSSTTCAVCVYNVKKNIVLAQNSEEIGRGHAEVLMPLIEDCLECANKSYAQIEKIHVTVGPGSFTGVRVGMAVARSLALSLDIPVCGISTLDACEAFTRVEYPEVELITVIDANRGEAYCKTSAGDILVDTYENLSRHLSAKDTHSCGSGANKLNEIADQSLSIIHQFSTAPIEFIAQMEVRASPTPPEPLYLRKADAKAQTDFTLPRAVE